MQCVRDGSGSPTTRYGYCAAKRACSRAVGLDYSVQPGASVSAFTLLKTQSGTRPNLLPMHGNFLQLLQSDVPATFTNRKKKEHLQSALSYMVNYELVTLQCCCTTYNLSKLSGNSCLTGTVVFCFQFF